jgi:tubulin polyglutamylase TTLL4
MYIYRGRKDRLTKCLSRFFFLFFTGRKDRLTKCLSRFRRRVGSANCDFYPRTYLLPSAYKQWREDFNNSKGIWIYKPGASARGIGIKVVTKLDQISKTKSGVCVCDL